MQPGSHLSSRDTIGAETSAVVVAHVLVDKVTGVIIAERQWNLEISDPCTTDVLRTFTYKVSEEQEFRVGVPHEISHPMWQLYAHKKIDPGEQFNGIWSTKLVDFLDPTSSEAFCGKVYFHNRSVFDQNGGYILPE